MEISPKSSMISKALSLGFYCVSKESVVEAIGYKCKILQRKNFLV